MITETTFSPGKSLSDMLGNQGKRALEKGIASDPDFTGRDSEAAAPLIRDNLGSKTKEFEGIEVMVVPPFERPEQGEGCKIAGIMKMRHITRTAKGELLGREIACFACLEQQDELCASCSLLPVSYPPQPKTRARARAAARDPAPEMEEQEMEQEQQGQEEQDLHLDKDIPASFGLLSERTTIALIIFL